ncbi:MAG: AraC family transcriptional regulator [Chloroflexi bacterium]|nr:MAG: AraC family transcriptional regulator [Chloroflexota bacterium]
MPDHPIVYTKLEPVLVAAIKTQIAARSEIPPLFEQLRAACGEAIAGDAMVIFHGGAVKDGFLVEAAYPVKRPVETDSIHTRALEAAPALTTLHHGPPQAIRETVLKVYDYLGSHAWTTSLFRREIYQTLDVSQPGNDVTEVQVILHEWDRLLAEGAEKVLGAEARQNLMQGIESITPESSFDDYTAWIEGAIARLDALTSDEQVKCQIVSRCAHVFPQERIEHLRGIYQRGEFDDILREMYMDDFWYEKPVRRGNALTMRKNPYDPEGYEKAATPAERRKAYCHCSFVHLYLDDIPSKLSPTFCFCGAGWYTRLWEGILGQPVRIERVETLLRGHDQCTLTITLPLELAGEYPPDKEKA